MERIDLPIRRPRDVRAGTRRFRRTTSDDRKTQSTDSLSLSHALCEMVDPGDPPSNLGHRSERHDEPLPIDPLLDLGRDHGVAVLRGFHCIELGLARTDGDLGTAVGVGFLHGRDGGVCHPDDSPHGAIYRCHSDLCSGVGHGDAVERDSMRRSDFTSMRCVPCFSR